MLDPQGLSIGPCEGFRSGPSRVVKGKRLGRTFGVKLWPTLIVMVDGHEAARLVRPHDLAELRVGDLPSTAGRYFPPGAKAEAERAAMADILAPLPARVRELFAEYQAGESREARLVKACDKLQLLVKVDVYQAWGAGGLAEFWGNPANFPAAGPDGELAAVREVLEELLADHPGHAAPEAARG